MQMEFQHEINDHSRRITILETNCNTFVRDVEEIKGDVRRILDNMVTNDNFMHLKGKVNGHTEDIYLSKGKQVYVDELMKYIITGGGVVGLIAYIIYTFL